MGGVYNELLAAQAGVWLKRMPKWQRKVKMLMRLQRKAHKFNDTLAKLNREEQRQLPAKNI